MSKNIENVGNYCYTIANFNEDKKKYSMVGSISKSMKNDAR